MGMAVYRIEPSALRQGHSLEITVPATNPNARSREGSSSSLGVL